MRDSSFPLLSLSEFPTHFRAPSTSGRWFITHPSVLCWNMKTEDRKHATWFPVSDFTVYNCLKVLWNSEGSLMPNMAQCKSQGLSYRNFDHNRKHRFGENQIWTLLATLNQSRHHKLHLARQVQWQDIKQESNPLFAHAHSCLGTSV